MAMRKDQTEPKVIFCCYYNRRGSEGDPLDFSDLRAEIHCFVSFCRKQLCKPFYMAVGVRFEGRNGRQPVLSRLTLPTLGSTPRWGTPIGCDLPLNPYRSQQPNRPLHPLPSRVHGLQSHLLLDYPVESELFLGKVTIFGTPYPCQPRS
ncbi:hypothetical protein J6590_074498 [Homalodisca vitripennis]|nr:hypothetical protein J6590_074498 [Homalodisca vitripennis]